MLVNQINKNLNGEYIPSFWQGVTRWIASDAKETSTLPSHSAVKILSDI